MAQKTRRQLQDLFKQGAKPSGDDFSDFVESTFNIKDDGLEKPVGADAPLKIISYGAEENLLDFYTGNSHSWRLNQKPSAAETAGLNFENAAGSSKLFIASSSGNVGVSTTSPEAKLHILQSGNADALRIDDTENDTTPLLIDKDGNVGVSTTNPKARLHILQSGNAAALRIDDTKNDSTPFLIDKEGKVGIGTTSPGEKLQVNGTVKATAFAGKGAALTNLSAGNITTGTLKESLFPSTFSSLSIKSRINSLLKIESSSTTGTLLRLKNTSGGGRDWSIFSSGKSNSVGTGRLIFSDQTGGGSRMTIDKDGKVGIGTTNPVGRLDVSDTDHQFTLTNSNKKDSWGLTNYNNSLYFQYRSSANASLSHPMLIDEDGKVGIGTTSPKAKLDVAGNINLTGDLTKNSEKAFMIIAIRQRINNKITSKGKWKTHIKYGSVDAMENTPDLVLTGKSFHSGSFWGPTRYEFWFA